VGLPRVTEDPGDDGMNLQLIGGVNHRTAMVDDRGALAFGLSEAFTVLPAARIRDWSRGLWRWS